jgi:hypothetical protein
MNVTQLEEMMKREQALLELVAQARARQETDRSRKSTFHGQRHEEGHKDSLQTGGMQLNGGQIGVQEESSADNSESDGFETTYGRCIGMPRHLISGSSKSHRF